MKKVIFISALAIAAAVSCTKSDIVDTKFDEQIGFDAYLGRDAQTKATVATSFEEAGIYGFYTGAKMWAADGVANPAANLWANGADEVLTFAGTVTPTRYWTNENDYYSFISYAPKQHENITPALDASSSNPTVTYKLSTDFSKQVDLLSARAINQKKQDKVTMQFTHALSRITVTAAEAQADYDYNIYALKLEADFPTTGSLNLKDDAWTSTAAESLVSYEFKAAEYSTGEKPVLINPQPVADTREGAKAYDFAYATTVDETVDGTTVEKPANYLMAIPTPVAAGETPNVTNVKLTVVYTTSYKGNESTPMTKEYSFTQTFVKGYAYGIALTFAPNDDNAISFDVSVMPWDETNEKTPIDGKNPEESPWK